MIALYDRDFVLDPYSSYYNIQLMKLYSYYLEKREMVSFITDLSRAPYYSKVYYRQDNPNIPFAPELSQYDNIDISGYAFGDNYVYLDDNIENTIADPRLYFNNAEQLFTVAHFKRILFRFLQDANHIQFYDKNNQLLEYQLKLQCGNAVIVLHDKNIIDMKEYINNLNTVVQTNIKKKINTTNCRIAFKYEQNIYNFEDLTSIFKLHFCKFCNYINYFNDISFEEYQQLCKTEFYTQQISARVRYILNPIQNEEKDLERILKFYLYSAFYKKCFNYALPGLIARDEFKTAFSIILRYTCKGCPNAYAVAPSSLSLLDYLKEIPRKSMLKAIDLCTNDTIFKLASITPKEFMERNGQI